LPWPGGAIAARCCAAPVPCLQRSSGPALRRSRRPLPAPRRPGGDPQQTQPHLGRRGASRVDRGARACRRGGRAPAAVDRLPHRAGRGAGAAAGARLLHGHAAAVAAAAGGAAGTAAHFELSRGVSRAPVKRPVVTGSVAAAQQAGAARRSCRGRDAMRRSCARRARQQEPAAPTHTARAPPRCGARPPPTPPTPPHPTPPHARPSAAGLAASGAIYIGVNLEFPGGPLSQSVHGEQFLVANLLLHGERGLDTLAISAAPCGHCRQFYSELACAVRARGGRRGRAAAGGGAPQQAGARRSRRGRASPAAPGRATSLSHFPRPRPRPRTRTRTRRPAGLGALSVWLPRLAKAGALFAARPPACALRAARPFGARRRAAAAGAAGQRARVGAGGGAPAGRAGRGRRV
jgi:hypothetical protein